VPPPPLSAAAAAATAASRGQSGRLSRLQSGAPHQQQQQQGAGVSAAGAAAANGVTSPGHLQPPPAAAAGPGAAADGSSAATDPTAAAAVQSPQREQQQPLRPQFGLDDVTTSPIVASLQSQVGAVQASVLSATHPAFPHSSVGVILVANRAGVHQAQVTHQAVLRLRLWFRPACKPSMMHSGSQPAQPLCCLLCVHTCAGGDVAGCCCVSACCHSCLPAVGAPSGASHAWTAPNTTTATYGLRTPHHGGWGRHQLLVQAMLSMQTWAWILLWLSCCGCVCACASRHLAVKESQQPGLAHVQHSVISCVACCTARGTAHSTAL
jgi:hypothetical protein